MKEAFMKIHIPGEAQYIIDTLADNGYEAYVVGGCVRDSLLLKEPEDWDICTPALPEQTMKCFPGHRFIETGLQHGTITLMLNHKPFEITTYRVDGAYTDHRHPDRVAFIGNLNGDLSRRDFTINALAYNPDRGVIDLFGGVNDLHEGILRCVGDPNARFQEDALRIMRALRFAATLDLSIDGHTARAMHDNRKLLSNIAAERIANELNRMIVGKGVHGVMTRHMPIIAEVIPELRTPVPRIDHAPESGAIRLAILLHGIGAHPQASSEMAKSILQRLKYDNDTIDTVTQLILYHDAAILPDRTCVKRWLRKIGEKRLRELIEVKRALSEEKSAICRREDPGVLDEIVALVNEIVEQRQCFSLKELAVNGRDLINMGLPEGARVGIVLNQLLDMVIDERIPNDKAALLNAARELVRE